MFSNLHIFILKYCTDIPTEFCDQQNKNKIFKLENGRLKNSMEFTGNAPPPKKKKKKKKKQKKKNMGSEKQYFRSKMKYANGKGQAWGENRGSNRL